MPKGELLLTPRTKRLFDESFIEAKKLNHNFYGTTAFYIIHLILLGYIDVDRDTWLYDAKLFDVDPSTDEEGNKLYDKVSPILIEKNLLTEEILKEIEENIN